MGSIVRKFGKLLDKRQKNRIVNLFILMLIGAFLEVMGVSLMLPLVSALMQPNIIETNEMVKWVCGVFDLHSHRTFVIICIGALILIYVIKDVFLMLQYYVQYRFVYNNRFATQQRLLQAYMKRPYEFYLHAESGEIVRVIQSDVAQTYGLLTTLLQFATESIVSFALILTILVVDPFMTLFVAVMMGGIMVIIAKVVKPILRREGLSLQKNSALTNKWLLQAINGMKEIKVTQKEQFFVQNYEKAGRKTIRSEKWNSVLSNVPRLLIEMVTVCSMLALIAILIFKGKEIELLLPSLGAFAMAAVKLLPSANRIVTALNAIAYQEPALDKMLENLEILENKNENTASSEKKEESRLVLEETIALNQITYSYPNSSKPVLAKADMVIPIGKSVGIVGTSGAGKTTAVDILLGLLVPQAGHILADCVDVMTNYHSWLSHIGYIPQTIFMLDDSIRANVAFGLAENEMNDDAVWHALEEAQLADFVRSLPEKLDTQIGERGVRLSGGQRQRIGIARALYSNPELLIFDEATSALDNETEAAIMEAINGLHGKKTLVIIAHRLQTIEGCDMVYRVANGRIERER